MGREHHYAFTLIVLVVAAAGLWALWQGSTAGQAGKSPFPSVGVKGVVAPKPLGAVPSKQVVSQPVPGGTSGAIKSNCRSMRPQDRCDGRVVQSPSGQLCCPTSCGNGVIDTGEECDDAAAGCFPGEACFGCTCWPLSGGGQTQGPPVPPVPPQGSLG